MQPSHDLGASTGTADAAEYAAAVLALVGRIPTARVMTYGLVAEIVGETLHRGGPRQVGRVLRESSGVDDDGAPLPWWRVLAASGYPPAHKREEVLRTLRAEGCPLSADGRRVDLRRAVWFPDPDADTAPGGSGPDRHP
ncbi:MGMT family protein [Cellulosimicrobium arenosum]|uniref:MGMT family protein n=1 Tax=Cellulosimicrobium arenosum TaxID=2708133 RepID=A0A927J2E7_9MICO|nr:MGMT family protein [Cellulosimicrobium arenosum]MBD8080592.1 MGMT family protein [Cellulosimicrobium arenosum]